MDNEDEQQPGTAPTASTLANAVAACAKTAESISECEAQLQALLSKQATLVQAQRILEHKTLADVIRLPLGFQNGRPVAALLVHRCLLRWGALTSQDSSTQALLDNVIHAITQELDEDFVQERLEYLNHAQASGSLPTSPGGAPVGPLSSGATTALGHFAYWLSVTST
eukprot:CAMPEP_0202877684 /NCGR_PEP_ID=MMETSP1391-20130828/31024_1 /ASSEMBLY_ACC=CAM_ASM_000867 /TAXON_ID=1034604 /ORGANISM="Chlamydomonas leiostraca, Strain SAG 11-49" /LENGTH=167 /DNA_ID=CAMNT_0049559763 /DNA_START=101 /DNA_END=600 /DNA_ORIENTATION=-